MENLVKKVMLSGFCEATFNVGCGEETDGYIIQIDGKNYAAYRDPDDGYRSYGTFLKTDKECTRTFPPQEVIMAEIYDEGGDNWYEEPKQSGIILKNPDTREIILDVSTVWYDSYYPVGCCSWHPENLPVNQKVSKYEGATITIIAEWYRECGDHMIIGKTEDGNYIEGIWSEKGIKFGPITGFQIINS